MVLTLEGHLPQRHTSATGNTALVGCALLEGRATFRQLAKSWFTSYAGNFVGSLAVVALVAGSGLLAPEAAAAKAAKVGSALYRQAMHCMCLMRHIKDELRSMCVRRHLLGC